MDSMHKCCTWEMMWVGILMAINSSFLYREDIKILSCLILSINSIAPKMKNDITLRNQNENYKFIDASFGEGN